MGLRADKYLTLLYEKKRVQSVIVNNCVSKLLDADAGINRTMVTGNKNPVITTLRWLIHISGIGNI